MQTKYKEYWEKSVPWTFTKENLSYAQRRDMRYSLQDYVHDSIRSENYEGKLVVELGSGSGIDSAEFGRNGAQVIGVDFTETGVMKTLATLNEAGLEANAIQADLHNLTLREGIADLCYSFGVLHHIPDVNRVILEINRVVRENGEFVGMVYNENSILYAYSIIFLHRKESKNERFLLRKYSERVINCPYTKVYTREEAIK